MTREEQIISEAKKHYYDDINCHNSFLHGVEQADEHPVDVWHDASEEPRHNELMLGIDSDGVSLYKLTIKRFASNVQEYNRVCAEELCELLNQEQ